ncbi:hypothetical protein GCM10010869_65510 [Mesorhizobium tianshanense]|uniref:Sulfur globule protein n=1 Tax=Mesorhizobium tianshanense TaxID=39844 RepID=A0A562NRC1_9HYPH|nr:hypothetical protein [Mesorhizobium tianshanense]TWI34620.1 hypothetical protein IQ26_03534 [Mesorhizobium tianshanense]GLS40954.1 hypothetical protein GCM10010869_65510 [Mesorhizobium tianshanense]
MTSKLIGIATAATIAIAALGSTASAAPLAAFGNTGQQSQAAGDLVVKIGGKHRGHRHHRHGHRWHKFGHGFYGSYYPIYDYGYGCWTKKKIFTKHGVFWKKIWICD